MKKTVDDIELPGMPPPVVPKVRKGSRAWRDCEWNRYQELSEKHSGLCSPPMAARMLGVSRQRVGALMNAGRLTTYEIFDRPYLACDEVDRFSQLERYSGTRYTAAA